MKKNHQKSTHQSKRKNSKIKHILKNTFSIIFILYILVFAYNQLKPLPANLNYHSQTYSVPSQNVEFLYDLTYQDQHNTTKTKQEIFQTINKNIQNSTNNILIDMFLFNSYHSTNKSYIPLSQTLTSTLVEKKQKNNITINFITDPINTMYQGSTNDKIEQLKKHNINVHFTPLNKLRDSNPLYSSFYRIFFIWFDNNPHAKIKLLPHLFNPNAKVTLRSYLQLLNFKANHRKVIVTQHQDTYKTIITSANPHDASSYHSNVAVQVKGNFAKEIYLAEQFPSSYSIQTPFIAPTHSTISQTLNLTLLTEYKIKKSILSSINSLEKGDEIKLAMFYISDNDIINSLKKASKKGVEIQIILDPNKDAFGYEKNGIPNRQVAYKLVKDTNNHIKIRWYNTQGEQFHTKLIIINKKNGTSIVILGSSNYTKRNLNNYNLEMNIMIKGKYTQDFFEKVNTYFTQMWTNHNNNIYTLDYNSYKDESLLKYLLYKIQEFTGISTF